jgi:hypothetical protein
MDWKASLWYGCTVNMVGVLLSIFRSEMIILLLGVTKTHRLPLLTPTALMAPGSPDATNESNLTIGPKAIKDMIDHFPLAKGAKSDPQLIWSFGESEVELRSLESSFDPKGMLVSRVFHCHPYSSHIGKGQLATELTISSEEFDVYNIYAAPTTIAFHLREFNVSEIGQNPMDAQLLVLGYYRLRRFNVFNT